MWQGCQASAKGGRLRTRLQVVIPAVICAAAWALSLAVIAATALSVPGGARRGIAVLGWRLAALFGVAGAVVTATGDVYPRPADRR